MENKFDTSAFIAGYMDAYGHEPSYAVVVDAAVEQLKTENLKIKGDYSHLETICAVKSTEIDILKGERDSFEKDFRNNYKWRIEQATEIQQLKYKLAKAKENLNTALNYLHWREDDLIGDDLIGDGRLTAEYKNKVSEIEKSILEIGEG